MSASPKTSTSEYLPQVILLLGHFYVRQKGVLGTSVKWEAVSTLFGEQSRETTRVYTVNDNERSFSWK